MVRYLLHHGARTMKITACLPIAFDCSELVSVRLCNRILRISSLNVLVFGPNGVSLRNAKRQGTHWVKSAYKGH